VLRKVPCHGASLEIVQPLIVTAANLGERLGAMIAALDRLAAPCGKAMQVETRLSKP
jgi:hypothetical protein